MTTSGSSIIGGRMPAPIGIVVVCRTTSGRSCSARSERLADEAGHYRYAFPKEYGGRDGTNLGMAIIREHFATKGLGLHNDLQNEHSIVGNNVGLLLMINYGTDEQKAEWVDDLRWAGGGSRSGSRSRSTGRTRRRWRPRRVATVTSGSSMVRRRGTRGSTRRSTT